MFIVRTYGVVLCDKKKCAKNLDITKKVVPLQCISGVIHNKRERE